MTIQIDTDVYLNLFLRRESIIYRDEVPLSSANVSYIVTRKLSADDNVSIVDRSGSLNANRVRENEKTVVSNVSTFTIDTDNFVLTDVLIDSLNSVTDIPLFYKHVVSETNVPRLGSGSLSIDTGVTLLKVELYDDLFNQITPAELSIDYDEGVVYSNLKSSFKNTSEYKFYYVKYSVDNNGTIQTFVEILSNQPVYSEATIDDIDLFTMALKPGRKAYLIEEISGGYKVTCPTVGTYAYVVEDRSKIQLLPPLEEGGEDPWYIRVRDGTFYTLLSGGLYKYSIKEFLSQSFFPAPPIKKINSETSIVVNRDVVKLDRINILQDDNESYHLNLLISDRYKEARAAFTTDSLLDGITASNGKAWQVWTDDSFVGIRSIDKTTGFVDIDGFELDENDIVTSEYNYSETEYEYVQVNLNPLRNKDILSQKLSVFIYPETGGTIRTQSLYYLLSDDSGRVIDSNWDRFITTSGTMDDGELLYYETFPSYVQTTVTGLSNYIPPTSYRFIQDFSVESTGVTNEFLVLGDVTVAEDLGVDEAGTFDSRVRGGGIRPSVWDDAVTLDPEVIWGWDNGNWDGIPYPGNSSYFIELPAEIMKGVAGTFNAGLLRETTRKHTAAGIYPIIKTYGADITISGIVFTANELILSWVSHGYKSEDIYFNIYYSQNREGPWSLANESAIPRTPPINTYTISGLSNQSVYYLGIVGGLVSGSNFTPYAAQPIFDGAEEAANIGTKVYPQIKTVFLASGVA